jgi:hypothetical protein
MWQTQILKDILPLVEENLKRKSSLRMIQVCRFWRHVLKDKVSDKYPIVINNVETEDKYSSLSWTTIICNCSPCPRFAKVKKLLLTKEVVFFDWDKLPKGLKMLSLNIADEFESVGNILPLSHLGIRFSGSFPYNIITSNIKKLQISGTDSEYSINFSKLDIAKYSTLHLKPTSKIYGYISDLTHSYESLIKLTVNVEIVPDLTCFVNLENLNIRCDEIDISHLPLKIEKLRIRCNGYMLHFSNIKNYEKITEYVIYLKDGVKILFPPNVKSVKIESLNHMDTIPQTVTDIACHSGHLDMVYNCRNIHSLKLGTKLLRGSRFQQFEYPVKYV